MADIRQEFIDEVKTYKKIIIYGAGHIGMVTLQFCIENLDLTQEIYVAVTECANNKNDLQGYPIHEISYYKAIRSEALVLVATSSAFFEEIDDTLKNLSFIHIKHIEDAFFGYCLYAPFMKLPIQKNKILVENFHGMGYGDSPKYIVEELKKRNLNIDIVWVVKKDSNYEFPDGIRTVVMGSNAFYREVFTSKIWICNVRKFQNVKKREGQFYLQTWHGTGWKKIESEADPKSVRQNPLYYDAGVKDSLMIDVLLSNCTFMTDKFNRCFYSPQNIVETGLPRNDIFFRDAPEIIHKVKEHFNIADNKKIVLYAPTFRNSYDGTDPFDLDIGAVLKAIGGCYGEEFVCLVRMHPNIKKRSYMYQYDNRIINASFYNDIMELLYASDVLITDYSSCAFDFMLSRKPVFLYASDLENYLSNDRGFNLRYDKTPFPIAETNGQMIENIRSFDAKKYWNELANFLVELGFVDDGKASKRAADMIIKHINESF